MRPRDLRPRGLLHRHPLKEGTTPLEEREAIVTLPEIILAAPIDRPEWLVRVWWCLTATTDAPVSVDVVRSAGWNPNGKPLCIREDASNCDSNYLIGHLLRTEFADWVVVSRHPSAGAAHAAARRIAGPDAEWSAHASTAVEMARHRAVSKASQGTGAGAFFTSATA